MITLWRLRELAQYLGVSFKELSTVNKRVQTLTGYVKWTRKSVSDWNSKLVDDEDRQQVEDWFKKNSTYLFELSEFHSGPLRKRITRQVLDFCKKSNVSSILDYGGGIGEDSIQAAKRDYEAWMADLPSQTMEYAKWRAKKYGLLIDFIEIKNDRPLKYTFDAITCFEVVQHLFNPEKVVKHLIKHLNPGGYLFLTTRFHNPEYPLALKKNEKYEEGMVEFITSNGMALMRKKYQYGEGEKTKHLFIYKKI